MSTVCADHAIYPPTHTRVNSRLFFTACQRRELHLQDIIQRTSIMFYEADCYIMPIREICLITRSMEYFPQRIFKNSNVCFCMGNAHTQNIHKSDMNVVTKCY